MWGFGDRIGGMGECGEMRDEEREFEVNAAGRSNRRLIAYSRTNTMANIMGRCSRYKVRFLREERRLIWRIVLL